MAEEKSAVVEQAEAQEVAGQQLEQDDEKLDEEAESLLAELAESQAEVQRMLRLQKEQAQELGGLKEQLAAELHDLQDDAWKLQVFGELEALKRQLAALNALEADIDEAEAVLDEEEQLQGRTAAAVDRVNKLALGGDDGGDDVAGGDDVDDDEEDEEEGEYNPEEIERLQAKLDEELAEMYAQLQSVKTEAAAVSSRKQQLEQELRDLLAAQEQDQGLVGAEELIGDAEALVATARAAKATVTASEGAEGAAQPAQ